VQIFVSMLFENSLGFLGFSSTVFGHPFVKRFTLCYQTIVLSVLLSVTVYWMDQNETWHAGRRRPWPHCVRCGLSSPSPKGAQPPPNSWPTFVVAKWLDGLRCHLVWR